MNKDNLSKYANLPKKIIERFKQGKMSFAHFSDTLRFELLREHGGVWIDATCFVSSEIPYYVFEHSFYSLNGAYAKDLGWKWTSWFMYAKKGDLLVENMCLFYKYYWEKYDGAVTYLFLDCFIQAMYNHIPEIKKEIDEIPRCGNCYAIVENWGKIYSSYLFKSITDKNYISKLTYKGNLPSIKESKEFSIYGWIVKDYINTRRND